MLIHLLSILVLLSSPRGIGSDAEATLHIGDPAPLLEVIRFVKGRPFTTFAPKKTYVVEFWGTWCGPCVRLIPHLTLLQKENPKVTFIGVSDLDDEPTVVKFVTDMGDKMGYSVAIDKVQSGDTNGVMLTTWMKAAGMNGFPLSFIVDDSRIAWVGHPRAMEVPLQRILANKWDLKRAAAEFESTPNIDDEAVRLDKLRDAAINEHDSAKYNEMLRSSWNSPAKYLVEFQTLSVEEATKPKSVIVKPDLEVCRKILEFVAILDRRSNVWTMKNLARVYYLQGEKTKAVATLDEILPLADEKTKAELKEAKEQYQK